MPILKIDGQELELDEAMAQTAEILFYLNWEQDHWQLSISVKLKMWLTSHRMK